VSGPVQRLAAIINQRGLHARASRKFASLALEFSDVRITVRKDGDAADGTSLMDLMMLGAGIGSEIEIEAEGERAAEALDALTALVADRFGEDE
jgi:phosphocarrier protein HPr